MAIYSLLAVIRQSNPTPVAAAPETRSRDLLVRSPAVYLVRHELVILPDFTNLVFFLGFRRPTGCLLDPRGWPHHKAKPADHEAMRAQANKHPRKRPRQCHRDRRPTSNMPCPSTRDQKPPGGGGGGQEEQSTFPPDLETKRRIRSRKLRHWLHKRLGQRRVEDWLNTSWTTDETMLSVE
ncbi:unnamed protein product [Schistocephalus solidus]|uniref:POP1 domain-containing protein n=1 Tax=Schistocephalus solidus TaxID=70667 RepID=A0A183TTB5_SCHSO|nr:unnamed protein product [Schistocephalus solidus]